MKSATIAVWLFGLAASTVAGESPSPAPPGPTQGLWREVLELRLEVCRQGIELADLKIRQFEAVVEAARAEHTVIEAEERAILQDLAGPDGEDSEIGARKAEMSGDELPKLQYRKQTAAQRAAEAGALLGKERERLEQLFRRMSQVEAQMRSAGLAATNEHK